jgi:hypothetical protein
MTAFELFAALLVKEPVHNILSETEIRLFQGVEGFCKIEKMALPRPAQNAQSSGDLQSFPARRHHSFLIIHQQQISVELKRQGNRCHFTGIEYSRRRAPRRLVWRTSTQAGGRAIKFFTTAGAFGCFNSSRTAAGRITVSNSAGRISI